MQATEAGNESVGFVYNGGTLSPQCIEVNNHTPPSTSFSNFPNCYENKLKRQDFVKLLPYQQQDSIVCFCDYICRKALLVLPQSPMVFLLHTDPAFAFNITAIAETLNQHD